MCGEEAEGLGPVPWPRQRGGGGRAAPGAPSLPPVRSVSAGGGGTPGAGRRTRAGTKVRAPGRRRNKGRRKPPGKAELGEEPGLRWPPGRGSRFPGERPGIRPWLFLCRDGAGGLFQRGLARLLCGTQTPKPLWIAGTVQSWVRSQLPVAGVAACWVEKLLAQGDPASPASLQSAEEPGRGEAGGNKGYGRMRGASRVHWSPTVPGLAHAPASPIVGSPGAAVRVLGRSGGRSLL